MYKQRMLAYLNHYLDKYDMKEKCSPEAKETWNEMPTMPLSRCN